MLRLEDASFQFAAPESEDVKLLARAKRIYLMCSAVGLAHPISVPRSSSFGTWSITLHNDLGFADYYWATVCRPFWHPSHFNLEATRSLTSCVSPPASLLPLSSAAGVHSWRQKPFLTSINHQPHASSHPATGPLAVHSPPVFQMTLLLLLRPRNPQTDLSS